MGDKTTWSMNKMNKTMIINYIMYTITLLIMNVPSAIEHMTPPP